MKNERIGGSFIKILFVFFICVLLISSCTTNTASTGEPDFEIIATKANNEEIDPENETFVSSTNKASIHNDTANEEVLNPNLELEPENEEDLLIADSNDDEISVEVEEPEVLSSEDVIEVYDLMNFNKLTGFVVDRVEVLEDHYVIKTLTRTPVYIIPINYSMAVRNDEETKMLLLGSGNHYELAQKKFVKNDSGEIIEIGMIANNFGSRYVMGLILSYSVNGQSIIFAERDESAIATVSYVAGRYSIYPNKIKNVLYGWANYSYYQDINGPMRGGNTYSFLNMTGLGNPSYRVHDFIPGRDGSGAITSAGGICANATSMSSLLFQVESGSNINKKPHATVYFQGPFSGLPNVVDATVYVTPEDYQDLTWRIADPDFSYYIKVDFDIFPLGVDAIDLDVYSDVFVIFTISLVPDNPVDQSDYLLAQAEDYGQFRNGLDNTIDARANEIREFTPNNNMVELASLVHGNENLEAIRDLIADYDFIEEMKVFQDEVRAYHAFSADMSFWKYIRTTEWYSDMLNVYGEEMLTEAFRVNNAIRIEGQPLQCIGFVKFLSTLYPEYHFLDVSSFSARFAYRLVPSVDKIYKDKQVYEYGNMITIGGLALTLDDYEPGDLFVNPLVGLKLDEKGYYDSIDGVPTGHIGAIVDKIIDESGEIILLGIDANQDGDGQIRIFVINEENADLILGNPVRFILRSPSSLEPELEAHGEEEFNNIPCKPSHESLFLGY